MFHTAVNSKTIMAFSTLVIAVTSLFAMGPVLGNHQALAAIHVGGGHFAGHVGGGHFAGHVGHFGGYGYYGQVCPSGMYWNGYECVVY